MVAQARPETERASWWRRGKRAPGTASTAESASGSAEGSGAPPAVNHAAGHAVNQAGNSGAPPGSSPATSSATSLVCQQARPHWRRYRSPRYRRPANSGTRRIRRRVRCLPTDPSRPSASAWRLDQLGCPPAEILPSIRLDDRQLAAVAVANRGNKAWLPFGKAG